MARPNEHGLELSFHGPSKRWRKRLGGKDYFFGPGKGISDRHSYRSALARYRDFRDRMALRQASAAFPGISVEPVLSGVPASSENLMSILTMLKLAYPKTSFAALEPPAPGSALRPNNVVTLPANTRQIVEQRVTAARSEAAVEEVQSGLQAGSSIDGLLDTFQVELRRRYDQTIAAPESLPPKKRLGGSGLRNLTASLQLFRAHLRKVRLTDFRDAYKVERALGDFRAHLDDQVACGRLKASTLEWSTKAIGPFFSWAWRNREIAEIPRNLAVIRAKMPRQPAAKPLELAAIQVLWAAADDRMRCFIALGLNCGFYAVDISSLEPGHLTREGYIVRYRHKTKIPTKHKLWPLTLSLVERHRSGKSGLLFTRVSKGHTLPWVIERDNGKYDAIGTGFSKLARNCGVRASWSQLRDTSAHFVEHLALSGEGSIDRDLVTQFLGHADSRMARFYLSQKPEDLERSKLDLVISKLVEIYGLSDEPKLAITSQTRPASGASPSRAEAAGSGGFRQVLNSET